MNIEGWTYYNHAAIPTILSYEEVDVSPIANGEIWKIGDKKLTFFARWTENFDCGFETEWWYIVKDSIFDIDSVKSKIRYEIRKGGKNFDVKLIDPLQYRQKLYETEVAALSGWPAKYRNKVDKNVFLKQLEEIKSNINAGDLKMYGAFLKDTDVLEGFLLIRIHDGEYENSSILRTNPEYEKKNINAILVYKWLCDAEQIIRNGGFIQNSQRNINHETIFDDYLENLFGFRKAYCKLRIEYNPKIKWIINIMYPCRNILRKFNNNKYIHLINGVMKMEEISRTFK